MDNMGNLKEAGDNQGKLRRIVENSHLFSQTVNHGMLGRWCFSVFIELTIKMFKEVM